MHGVMQLLYQSQQAHPDICTAVSCLCGRLHHADMDNYRVVQLIKYLHGTLDFPLRLSSDGLGTIKCWVDALYVVSPNMKGHRWHTIAWKWIHF